MSFLDSRWSLYLVIGCSILLMTILAWYDAKIGTISGMSTDTLRFHRNATRIANGEIEAAFIMGAEFYEQLLGMFYKLTAPDEIFGNMLSVFTSALALFYFVKCLDALSAFRFQSVFLLLLAFDPTFLLHGSVTLRESFQLLFLVLGIFFIIRLFRADTRLELTIFTGLFGCSMFILACLHLRALLPVAMLVLFAVGAVYLFADRGNDRKVIVAGTVITFFLVIWLSDGAYHYKKSPFALSSEQHQTTGAESKPKTLFQSLEKYRNKITNFNPRSLYPVPLEFGSIERFIKSGTLVYGQYLFYPFPINIKDARDFVPAMGSLFRMAILVYLLTEFLFLKANKPMPVYIWSILGLYIVLSGLWALGSTNYGQAFRHHMLSNWLLVLCSACLFNAGRFKTGSVESPRSIQTR